MMSGVLKIMAKAALVLTGSLVLGYAEYRIKGGKPIRQLYQDVQAQKLAAAMAAKANTIDTIKADGTVK